MHTMCVSVYVCVCGCVCVWSDVCACAPWQVVVFVLALNAFESARMRVNRNLNYELEKIKKTFYN